ncbi:MAG: cytochrome c [Desulfuromonadaceae bacterium]|nr:cytochrome c [Desulfuromonadaceae bacterium]
MSSNDPHHDEHADGIIEDREQRPPVYFYILFFGLIIWAVIFMAYYLLSGWSSDAEFQQKMTEHKTQVEQAAPAATAPVSIDATTLFADNCAVCHGSHGEGGIGPALHGAAYIYGKDVAAIKASITSGRPNGMPNFGNQLSAAEISALAEYLLKL